MRVFHGVHNISGIPGIIAKHERALGLDSQSYCFPNNYGFTADHILSRDNAAKMFGAVANGFDVFNLNFGYGFFDQSLADYDFLKRSGKAVNTFFHGCDVRDAKRVIKQHAISACHACWPAACNANRREMRRWADDHADHILVSTPDLLEFFDRAQWLPQAVEVEALQAVASAAPAWDRRRPVLIAHAPSSPLLKGTTFVRHAIDDLKASGAPVQLVELSGMSHADVLKAIAASDLVVDQLLIGSYGVVSIEAMALGKPTICYIRDDLVGFYPRDLPIVRASTDDLSDVIADLLDRPQSWAEIGRASSRYAERTHGARAVARRLKMLYEPDAEAGPGRLRSLSTA